MLNKVIIMGRLTADPELKQTPSGVYVTTFTLAVDRQNREQTDFIDVVAWRSTAEFVCKWFSKGLQVAVSGRLQVREWSTKDGYKRKAVEVIADEVFFAEKRREQAAEANEPEYLPDAGQFDTFRTEDPDLPFMEE